MTLQRATLDDIDIYHRLEQSVAGQKTYSVFSGTEGIAKEIKENIVYFIKKENEYMGMVEYRMQERERAYIGGLVVDPRFQGQGISRQAMNMIFEELKEVTRFDLVVHPENIAALMLYLSFGFVVQSWKDNYFGDGEPRLAMSLFKKN